LGVKDVVALLLRDEFVEFVASLLYLLEVFEASLSVVLEVATVPIFSIPD